MKFKKIIINPKLNKELKKQKTMIRIQKKVLKVENNKINKINKMGIILIHKKFKKSYYI